jgi:hypothetical protein
MVPSDADRQVFQQVWWELSFRNFTNNIPIDYGRNPGNMPSKSG